MNPGIPVALHMADSDFGRINTLVNKESCLLRATSSGRHVGVNGTAGLLRCDGDGLAGLLFPLGDLAVGGGPLDDARLDVGALDNGAHIVETVDALNDVGDE